MKQLITKLSFAISISTLLFGCGGGGSTTTTPSGPVTSTLAFPLLSGLQAFTAAGESRVFTVSGNCTGSGNITSAPANTPTTFEGVAGFSSVSTFTWTLNNCTPASYANTAIDYYDSSYIPIGYDDTAGGGDYALFLTPPSIPASVNVGGAGIIGTRTLYTSSTKAILSGTSLYSYAIEADTASTAIINLISKHYNASGILTSTSQNRYRISSTGVLTRLSQDVQYANGSTLHIVLTFN